ncbi:uncharacterized protein LOC113464934 [Ceratina calcarata]|uniref:Uncharacterized protein LOC113464934 n=1 Tax=Ceratina calcarata TaxID=156304 RepID=A0AAJ7SAE0_9HYME|nr:uncharacterized protein LOC113464934 [Ceratina calcarata]
MDIKILQSNLNNSHAAHLLLIKHCAENNIDICVISEPRKNPGAGWLCDSTGKASIYLHNKDNDLIMKTIATVDGFILVGDNQIKIGSCYFSPSKSPDEFEQYLKQIGKIIRSETKKSPLIIGGDFNAHSKIWGSKKDSKKGKSLVNWALSNGLFLINKGNSPTCVRTQGSSIVDLTWANEQATRLLWNWRVLSEVETLSDHVYITMSLHAQIRDREKARKISERVFPRWNTNKINLDLCSAAIIADSWHLPEINTANLNRVIENLENILTRACNASMPKKRNRSTKPPNEWWCNSLSILRSECQKRRREWQRARRRSATSDDELSAKHDLYKETKKVFKKEMLNAKKKAWTNLLKTLDDDPWGKPYKWTKRLRDGSGPVITENMNPGLLENVVNSLFPDGPPWIPPGRTTEWREDSGAKRHPDQNHRNISRLTGTQTP